MTQQISSRMMDNLKPVELGDLSHSERIAELYRFMVTIQMIQDIGWFEHTSDWDPYLVVCDNNADTFECETGYAEFHLSIDGENRLNGRLGFADFTDDKCEAIQFIIIIDDKYRSPIRIDDIESIMMILP